MIKLINSVIFEFFSAGQALGDTQDPRQQQRLRACHIIQTISLAGSFGCRKLVQYLFCRIDKYPMTYQILSNCNQF